MKNYLVVTFLLIVTNFASGQIPIDSIKTIIKQEVAGRRSKSIIVGIVDARGRQIFAEGIKSDSDNTLPDGNTIYEIGSITKVFTSLLLAEMSLKKQLNLDDPIAMFLPKTVKTPTRNGKTISLLSLATHRSGMPRFPFNVDPKDLDKPYVDYTVDKLYEYISNFEPPFDIDSQWKYSNVAYGLLGNILSLVAHRHFEELITGEICVPLNMHNTVVSLTTKQKSNLAIGHAETGIPVGLTDLGAIDAGGALRSNVNDLLTFAEANMGLIKTNLFPAMELTHVLRAKKDGGPTFTTMGWTLVNDDGKTLLFKDGGMPGYCSFLGIDPKNKFAVVILSNSSNSVSDIGWHVLDSTHQPERFKYPWSLLDTLRTTARARGANGAIQLYQQLKAGKNGSFIFNEHQLNYLGNELRRAGKIKAAVKIYELNVQEYPGSTLVFESLGEMHRRNNNRKMAIRYFEKARELDPQNPHWNFILEKIANDAGRK
jgi:CubicO group peptidase (beta-lactamase class C family)